MIDLPSEVLEYIIDRIIKIQSPAYFRVGKDGCLIGWGGNLSAYGIKDLIKDKVLGEQVFFLDGHFGVTFDGVALFGAILNHFG